MNGKDFTHLFLHYPPFMSSYLSLPFSSSSLSTPPPYVHLTPPDVIHVISVSMPSPFLLLFGFPCIVLSATEEQIKLEEGWEFCMYKHKAILEPKCQANKECDVVEGKEKGMLTCAFLL